MMKKDNSTRVVRNIAVRLFLAGWTLCLLPALFTPLAEGTEAFDWMPPQMDEHGLNSQDLGGEQILPEITITKTPKQTADMSKFTKEYVLELNKFNISNDGTSPAETSKGLNQALQHAKTLGANRIVFPKGTYLISETDPVVIDHKNTIIDLNGATLQINANGLPKYGVVEIVDGAENVRLTNGTVRGDKDKHDFSTARSHEWGHCLILHGGLNLEVDHLHLTNATGDGANTRTGNGRTRPEQLARIAHTLYARDVEKGAFFDKGAKIDSTEKTRSIKACDLTACEGEFEFGYSTGYLGYPFIKSRIYQAYFYDAGMKFLVMKKCLQFRKVTVPRGAKFVHLEFNQPEVSDEPAHAGAGKGSFIGRITNFKPPTDVHFHHNTLVANRRLGLAYCGGQKWLIEDNLFEGNGGTAPAYGIDFEDGWELMQDVVVRSNRFKGNAAGDLVICAGSELLIEGNVFEKNVTLHGRPHNYTFRNNTYTGGRVGYMTRTGVASIHNNSYENCTVSIVFDNKAVADGLYRKPGETVATPPLTLADERMVNVSTITGTYFDFRNATFKNTHFVVGDETRMVNLQTCEFDSVSLEYTADGPDVHVRIEGCKGDLEQKGPGLHRRMPAAAETKVAIRSDFPGGNVIVHENTGNKVMIAPDLRGGRPWFYWCFEATVDRPGRITFVLPETLPGLTGPPIGMQGPAVSLDLGKTWKLAGADHVKDNTFFYDFTEAGRKVRFAVTIPYLQSNLDAFFADNASSPHLTRSVLTQSLKGRDVELLQIGRPAPGKKAVLFTARHHACETMASYVLEGFLTAAISDGPEAIAFRRNYVLYVVPFVDKDGVEEGDQGKNRAPHDHNRDYGEGSLYPEVDAIEKLGDTKNIQFLLDCHCPTLRYGDHQVMYFVGTRQTPVNNVSNVEEFARLIKEGLPPNSPVGPLVWLSERDAMPLGSNCNRYFAFRKGAIMAATIEIPYAPPGKTMDAEQCRKIGQAMMNAWANAKFLGNGQPE